MDVLDDVQQGALDAKTTQQRENRLEQAQLRQAPGWALWRLVDDRIRQQAGQVGRALHELEGRGSAHQPAQRLGERGERQRVTGNWNTRSGKQARLLPRHQLAHQPGLADSHLAGHDDHTRRPLGSAVQRGT